jgi:hypothetical protein
MKATRQVLKHLLPRKEQDHHLMLPVGSPAGYLESLLSLAPYSFLHIKPFFIFISSIEESGG